MLDSFLMVMDYVNFVHLELFLQTLVLVVVLNVLLEENQLVMNVFSVLLDFILKMGILVLNVHLELIIRNLVLHNVILVKPDFHQQILQVRHHVHPVQ